MRRGATFVCGMLMLSASCGSRTDPWSVPGLSGATPTAGGSGVGGAGNGSIGVGTGTGGTGIGAGGTGAGAGTGAGGTGAGSGGTGSGGAGAGGAGTGGTGTGGAGNGTGSGGTGAGGSGTGGVGAGGSGAGGAGNGGTGGTGTGGSAGTGGGRDGGTACFKPLQSAVTPLDVFLLLDKSAPMGLVDPPDVAPNTRWARMTRAIDTFAQKAEVSRLGLGLIPHGLRDDPVPSCNPRDYANIPVLAFHSDLINPLISKTLAAQSPGNETWTRPALEGSLSYALFWSTNPPSGETASLVPPSVVLVTGAQPTGCGGTVADLANAARASFRDPPHVRTHVVTIGPDATGFDVVAQSGGTHHAYSAQSLDLDEIFVRIGRTRRICDIPFYEPYDHPDFARLEVRIRLFNGDPLVAIPRRTDLDGCGSEGGWFLEPPANPTMIMICPSTCAAIVDAPAGQILAGQVFNDQPCVDASPVSP